MSLYASEPAPPTLAHSLLSLPVEDITDTHYPSTSNLEAAIEEGLQRPPSGSLFRCGVIIGFSRPRQNGRDEDQDHESVGQIPRYILTNNLRKSPSPTSSSFEPYDTFIIHPVHYDVFSPQNLLSSLLSPKTTGSQSLPSSSREEAISRLDTVQLLPVFDFPAAAQAINQLSDTLNRIGEERRYHDKQQQQQQQQQKVSRRPVVLVIAGLDTLVEGVIRASNPIKGTAVLNAVLRMLTQMSRVHASFLSIMLVNTSGLGTGIETGPGTTQPNYQGGGGEQRLSLLLPSLLLKTLDQGIDTHFLVSRVRDGKLVEVIKDRVGDGSGKRCVWNKT